MEEGPILQGFMQAYTRATVKALRPGAKHIPCPGVSSNSVSMEKRPELVVRRCSDEEAGKVVALWNMQDQQKSQLILPGMPRPPSWVLQLSGARSRELTPSSVPGNTPRKKFLFATKSVSAPARLIGFPGSLVIFIHSSALSLGLHPPYCILCLKAQNTLSCVFKTNQKSRLPGLAAPPPPQPFTVELL